MHIDCPLADYIVTPGTAAALGARPTGIEPLSSSKPHYRKLLDEYREEIEKLQSMQYAHNRYALLLIFQGMDTAGKGGAIKHVMSGVNPQGCEVHSFGPPSEEELDHDFLWRTSKRLPQRGRIGIFDRSYYEEVLVVRVKPYLFAKQRIPRELVDPRTIWHDRCRDIVNLESYLHRNGTRIVKFFLHLSREEQRRRLLARIDEPDKNWKFNAEDLRSRQLWDDYQKAFEECLSSTSTESAPWYVVPADDKRNARLIVSHAIVETMKSLEMDYPKPDADQLRLLDDARQALQNEGSAQRA